MAEQTRQDAIANNIANVNTPGFKEDLAVIQARSAEATEKSLPTFATPLDAMGGAAFIARRTPSTSRGRSR